MIATAQLDFRTSASPEGHEAIRRMINRVLDQILQDAGPERIVSVVLTGAMAEGEGTVLIREDGTCKILSDLDIYLVARPGSDLETLRSRVRSLAEALRRGIPRDQIASGFDLAAVSADHIGSVDTIIGTLDLRNRGRVIWGEDVLASLPLLESTGIPPRNAVTLVLNRIVEELGFRPEDESFDAEMAIYHAAKTGADMALAVLSFLGEYRSTYRERLSHFGDVWNRHELQSLRERLPDLPDRMNVWTEYKLTPDLGLLSAALGGDLPSRAEDVYPALQISVREAVEAVWIWAVRSWTGAAEQDPLRLADRLTGMVPLRERVRGWRKLWPPAT